jgi:hypothetical protein
MNDIKQKKVIITTILLLMFANFAAAQDSKEYAAMGTEAWSAFECSSLASHIKDTKEAERLFLFGYEQGKKFIRAIKANKIEKEDISSGVPMIMLLLLQGPSEDFMLGRIYENAQEHALEKVFKTDAKFNSEQFQKDIAKSEFRNRNCQFIGKRK